MIENLIPPSWRRYKDLFFLKTGRFSILRILQYEVLKKKTFKGNTLDFGGGAKADYHQVVSFELYESVNIAKSMAPTWLTSIGEELPCPTNYYDTVLSMNTFEHVFDARFYLEQLHTALKKDGKIVCATPFLFPLHAYPQDYFRPTDMWWRETLQEIGFVDIKIIPLLWGPFSTGLVCSAIPGPFKTLRIHIALLLDWLYIRLGKSLGKQFINDLPYHSLGFFVEATKE